MINSNTIEKRRKQMQLEETSQGQANPLPAANHYSTTCSYEIRVKDHLDPSWCNWFEGWSLSNLSNGEVLMSSTGIDQAALYGVLIKIRDLNLTLISVAKMS
jgi:hypothetical protein